ncbi:MULTISPECIES: conjugal transfer protein TraG N-terminal domain-containing protein [unclassified Methylocaldum]|uniref:conjugal transfer protein TraG N-terminal domain-containing protein n=1 Tax=unclassified Methylocaldum TaxID=2622260 RepID=UPI001B42475E|nr:conjugal transfer protein TraG N-terminal domain-containing protein [Methylocaldum sp. RMAD-M]MBP1151353.1 conjugal transfer mating pair stabilization protein TraG [Methylocaldum sp. RMAD-M]
MFEIFSVGDSAYLEAVLNAVAMIAQTGDYRMAASVGAVMGVILVMIRSLVQWDGRGIRYQDMLIAVVLWMIMYSPAVRVSIEDAYTGDVRVVDNVPLGPAAVGSILSNMGYRTTRLFEQAFSLPTMTEHGFADTLTTITAVRKNLLSRMHLGGANAPSAGGDVENSVINYVKECALTGVDLNRKSIDEILRDPDPLNAIRFDTAIYTTEIYVGGPPRILTCTDAWTQLSAYIDDRFVPLLEDLLTDFLGVPAPADVTPKVQDAFDALAGAGAVDALQYMKMAAILPMFEKGVVGRHEDAMHWNKAAMVEQAIQQRNTQWAAEETLFNRIVRPMMAFIEGLSYAIAPIMAFVIMLGALGVRMNVGYFSMLLWIQLWMPILAVVNLFIQMAASSKLAALTGANFSLPSMYGIYKMDQELQNWLAVGGMLAASTPAITLMLIYRGAVTATHFLGRMDGGDHVNERIATPDVIGPAPVMNIQPMHQQAPLSGVTLHGAERVLPTFNAGTDLNTAVSSAYAAMEQASSNFMSSLQESASRSYSFNTDAADLNALATKISNSASHTDKFLLSVGEDLAQKYSHSRISGDQVAAALAGGIGGDFARHGNESRDQWFKRVLPKLAGEIQSNFKVGAETSNAIAADILSKWGEDHGFQTGLERSLVTDAQQSTRDVAAFGLQSQELSTLQRSATDALSASETYNETVTTQRRFGAQAAFGAAETGMKIARDAGLFERLSRTLDRYGLVGDTQRLAAEWRAIGLIADRDQAYAAAGLSLLTGFSAPHFRSLDAEETRKAELAGYQLLGDVWHAPSPGNDLNAGRNANLRDAAPAFGEVQSQVEQVNLYDPRGDTAGIEDRVQSRIRQEHGRVASGEASVNSAYHDNLDVLRRESNEARRDIHGKKADHFRAEIARAANDSSLAEFAYDYLGGALYSIGQSLSAVGAGGKNLGGLGEDLKRTYEHALADGKNPAEAGIEALAGLPQSAAARFRAGVNQWVDERVAEVADRLTPAQQDYYRAAIFETFAGLPWAKADLGTDMIVGINRLLIESMPSSEVFRNAERGLLQENPETGEDIAQLLRQAATQHRPDLIDLVGNYNRATGSVANPTLNAVTGSRVHSVPTGSDPVFMPEHPTPPDLAPIFNEMESRYDLPPGLLERMAGVESKFNPSAKSPKGAVGIMQLMPATAKRFGVTDRTDPRQSIEGGAKYVRWLLDHFQGDLVRTVAAYNAGEGDVERYNGIPPFPETQDYVRRVLGDQWVARSD